MKKIFSAVLVAAALTHLASGAVVSAGIRGSVNNPTTSGSAALADTTYAVLLVDVSGGGFNLSSTLTLQEGNTYGNMYVASVFAATNNFLGDFATSAVTSVSWETTGNLAAQPSTGDKYYVVWFSGLTGASEGSTQVTLTNGQAYGYASGSDWLVPANGATATPAAVSSGFQYGTIVAVPEPSVALLGAIGGLALLRRRRN